MLVNQYNQYYMKLLANQQMQSRLIYLNDVPPINEMNPMQFLDSQYTQNMQYLSQLQAEAYNITQCLQQIKNQLEQISTADNTSLVDQNNLFLRPPSSHNQEPHSWSFHQAQTISRPSDSDVLSNSKTFEQACQSSSKNSVQRDSMDRKDNSMDKSSRKGKPIRKRQRIKP